MFDREQTLDEHRAATVQELDAARRDLYFAERAQLDGRVTSMGLYRHELRRAHDRVRTLEADLGATRRAVTDQDIDLYRRERA